MRLKIAIAAFATALSAIAQTDSLPAQTWTLQQCLDYAMAHNLTIKQKQIAIERSEIDTQAREGALWPSLSFATGHNMSWRPWSERYVNLTDGTMTTSSSELNYNGSYGLSAQWTVWNGGRNRKQLQRSRIEKQISTEDEAASRLQLQEQIVQVYVQILYQREAVEVNKRVLESTQVQMDRAQQMYDIGQISRAELTQMQAQLSQQKYNVVNSQTQLESFKLQLKKLLEIVGPEEIDVAVPAINEALIQSPLPEIQQVYEQALSVRPEIKYNRLNIQSAEMGVDIARRGYYPTLSMSAGINTTHSSGLDTSFGEQLKRNLNNSVGLTLSVPIFDNRTNRTNVASARLDLDAAEIALAQQQKELYSNIETCWLNAENSKVEYSYATANVESMRESYRLVSEQFDVGLKNIVDLNTGRNDLLQAVQQLLQSKYMAVLNRALLKFYSGAPLTLE